MTPAPPIPASWRWARKLLFSIDAERVHHLAMASLSAWSRVCSVDLPSTDVARAPALQVQAFGLTFPNPLGLAAGFDKDAVALAPQSGEAQAGLGMAMVYSDTSYRKAIPLLLRGTQDEPDNERYWLALGIAYQNANQSANARKAYKTYLKLKPEGASAREVRSILSNL